jgi:hypothetical protein
MLYENEDITRPYDPETGQEVDEALVKRSETEGQEVIEIGKQLQAMKNTAGWKLVEEFLTANTSKYTNLLISEQDEKKIFRLQEAVKSYSNVLNVVEQAIFEANSLEQNRTLHQGANPKE